jgi:hypothetical protein
MFSLDERRLNGLLFSFDFGEREIKLSLLG